MTEKSYMWDGTVTGDANQAPYDASSEFSDMAQAMTGLYAMPNKGGVLVANASSTELLAAATATKSPVVVQPGKGVVAGTYYLSDAAISVVIPSPAALTRIDRLVLRKSWAAETVRLTRVAGAEGGGAPALTQTWGTTWDLPLWSVSIAVGGVITLTDERVWLPTNVAVRARMGNSATVWQVADVTVWPVVKPVKMALMVVPVLVGAGAVTAYQDYSPPEPFTDAVFCIGSQGAWAPDTTLPLYGVNCEWISATKKVRVWATRKDPSNTAVPYNMMCSVLLIGLE